MSEASTVLRGVVLTKTNPTVLKRFVKKLKVDADTNDRDSMVVSIADYFKKLHKDDDPKADSKIVLCDDCNGPSDDSVDACPYCGAKDGAPPATTTPEEPKPAAAKKAKGAKAEPVVDEKPTKVKGKGAKLAVVEHKAEIVSAGELDRAVEEIKEAELSIVGNHWKIGSVLADIVARGLFKLRLNDKGKPAYTSFGQMVEKEIQYSPRYAYALIGISQTFSEKQIREVDADGRRLGVAKLRPMVKIPDEAKRNQLLERAKKETLSREQIEEEAKKLAAGAPAGRPAGGSGFRGGEAGAKKATDAATEARRKRSEAKEKEQGVTAVFQLGRTTLPLIKSNGGEDARAFSIADEPTAVEETINGIKIRYRVVEEAEGWSLVVERTRDTE